MNSVSLYKTPFHPHNRPGLWRYLLERDADLYIYFYLEEPDGLHSFQIVYHEAYVITFFENRISIGQIKTAPFSRVIAENGFHDKMHAMQEALRQLESADLPQTLELIKTAMLEPFGPNSPRLKIPAEEVRFLSRLKETPGKETLRSY